MHKILFSPTTYIRWRSKRSDPLNKMIGDTASLMTTSILSSPYKKKVYINGINSWIIVMFIVHNIVSLNSLFDDC